ncbi:MAG: GNAT family N-acetyltransferase [Bdellovibrionales bacterium]
MIQQRAVSLQDAPALAALHARCFGDEAWSQEQIEGSLRLPTTKGIAIWEKEDFPIAMVLLQCVGDEIEILTLGVEPSLRRLGLARHLMKLEVFRIATGPVFLEVAADNEAACALYEFCGFELIGRRAGYYARPGGAVDALNYRFMVKS